MKVSYAKYNEINTGETTLTFNQLDSNVEVITISKGLVVLKSLEQKNIDDCINNQNPQISAVKISKEVFTELAKDSEAVKAIDFATGARIRAKYRLEDELSMHYKANDNPEKIAFLQYRAEQIEKGRSQKEELGLL